MLNIFYLLFMAIYVFYLPGNLISRIGFKKESRCQQLALSFSLSIVLIPIISFGAALLLHTTVGRNLILAIASIINITCLFISLSLYLNRKFISRNNLPDNG